MLLHLLPSFFQPFPGRKACPELKCPGSPIQSQVNECVGPLGLQPVEPLTRITLGPASGQAGGRGPACFDELPPPEVAGVPCAQPCILFSLLDPWTKDGRPPLPEFPGSCWRGSRGLDILPAAGEEGALGAQGPQVPPLAGGGIHGGSQPWRGSALGAGEGKECEQIPLRASASRPSRKQCCLQGGASAPPGDPGSQEEEPLGRAALRTSVHLPQDPPFSLYYIPSPQTAAFRVVLGSQSNQVGNKSICSSTPSPSTNTPPPPTRGARSINKPRLARHYHREAATHPVGLGKCMRTRIPLPQHHTESSQGPKNAPCSAASPASRPQTQQPLIFLLSPQFCLFQKVTGSESYCTRPFQTGLFHPSLLVSGPVPNLVTISRLQMRTPRHRELRWPGQCHRTSKWHCLDSSLGPLSSSTGPLHLGHAPGIRNYRRQPARNSPSNPIVEARLSTVWGRRRGGSPSCPSIEARSPVPRPLGRETAGSRSGHLSAAAGGNPGLDEEAGGPQRRRGGPGPRGRLPGRAGESPHGPAGREGQSGLPGPAAA